MTIDKVEHEEAELRQGMESRAAAGSTDEGPTDADLVAMIKRGDYDEALALAIDEEKADMVRGMIKSRQSVQEQQSQQAAAPRQRRPRQNLE